MTLSFEEITIDLGTYITDKIRSLLPRGEVITLTSSDYTPNYGSTVTLTVTAKSNDGSPLTNKQLRIIGSHINTVVTTNEYGTATVQYTPKGGSNFIRCGDSSINIEPHGYIEIANLNPHANVYYNGRTVRVVFHVYTDSDSHYRVYELGYIPEGYRSGANFKTLLNEKSNGEYIYGTVEAGGRVTMDKSYDTRGGNTAYGTIEYDLW